MYQMIINNEYKIIESVFKYQFSDPRLHSVLGISSKTQSIIPGCTTSSVSLEEVPNNVMAQPRAFIYDNNEYKTCPFFYINVKNHDDVLRVTKNNEPYLILNTDVIFQVIFMDPDNIGFKDKFEYVKLKDRFQFLFNLPERLDLDENNIAEFKAKSRFPGMTKLRAKDNQYLCNFYPLTIRFRDDGE